MPSGIRFPDLAAWLQWQQAFHPKAIDPGLERIRRVLQRTGWKKPASAVLTIAGTNGKGSCVAMAESILLACGYRTGSFTSPHLIDYRERVRLDGRMTSEASLVTAFERIVDSLGADSLTYFEFNALAALLIIETFRPDVTILEVGMGGRLDAVNVVDADVSIIASISVDHEQWLGSDTETIGREKAGVFRPDQPAIFGSGPLPLSVAAEARRIGARLQLPGRDFKTTANPDGTWNFRGRQYCLDSLPWPGFGGVSQLANAAATLAALFELPGLRLAPASVAEGLRLARLPGRLQRLEDSQGCHWILDVAHNPGAVRELVDSLGREPVNGRTVGIVGLLADKDASGIFAAIGDCFDELVAVETEGVRGQSDVELVKQAAEAGVSMRPGGSVADAIRAARRDCATGDRLVVFGSFHTVGPALGLLRA
jgi:dihydrofolate synthase/folylpolyglutamate synthase